MGSALPEGKLEVTDVGVIKEQKKALLAREAEKTRSLCDTLH